MFWFRRKLRKLCNRKNTKRTEEGRAFKKMSVSDSDKESFNSSSKKKAKFEN